MSKRFDSLTKRQWVTSAMMLSFSQVRDSKAFKKKLTDRFTDDTWAPKRVCCVGMIMESGKWRSERGIGKKIEAG